MTLLLKLLIGLIAFEHIMIMFMEMFLWEKRGPSIFSKFPTELFSNTVPLAKNLGLYNGFLAGGLIWSTIISDAQWGQNIAVFFLICVIIAGIHAAFTAEKSVFMKQSIPAIVVLIIISVV